jgi:hypothetical protein
MLYTASDQSSLKLHLKSQNATSSMSSCNKTFIMKSDVECNEDNKMLLSITDFSFPVVYYLIDETNQILSFDINYVNYELTIPIGGYNVVSLRKKIISLWYFFGYKLDMTFDSDTLKYTFFITRTNDVTPTSIVLNITPFCKVIGFSGFQHHTTVTVGIDTRAEIISNDIVNFVKTRFIKLKSSSFITSNLNSEGANDSTIASFSVTEKNHGDELTYQSTYSMKYLLGIDKIQHIHLVVTDDDDRELEIHNHFFSVTFQIDFIKK